MTYREVYGDLFDYYSSAYLAHCISADFALGKGIAVQFRNRFNMQQELFARYPNYLEFYQSNKIKGQCLPVKTIMNLVTKERYWQKPTYSSLRSALDSLHDIAVHHDMKTIAMPLIGCGLDRLEWSKVSNIITSTFSDTGCQIIIVKR